MESISFWKENQLNISYPELEYEITFRVHSCHIYYFFNFMFFQSSNLIHELTYPQSKILKNNWGRKMIAILKGQFEIILFT